MRLQTISKRGLALWAVTHDLVNFLTLKETLSQRKPMRTFITSIWKSSDPRPLQKAAWDTVAATPLGCHFTSFSILLPVTKIKKISLSWIHHAHSSVITALEITLLFFHFFYPLPLPNITGLIFRGGKSLWLPGTPMKSKFHGSHGPSPLLFAIWNTLGKGKQFIFRCILKLFSSLK